MVQASIPRKEIVLLKHDSINIKLPHSWSSHVQLLNENNNSNHVFSASTLHESLSYIAMIVERK